MAVTDRCEKQSGMAMLHPKCILSPNAFGCVETRLGISNHQMHLGTNEMHLGTIINTKCISGRSRQLLECKPLPNAFCCVQMHLVTSQMDFHSAPPARLDAFGRNEMHLDVTKCISLCHEMRTDENCKYQPLYIIRFHAAVVNAVN
jgi:hypothetical protein